MDDAYFFQDESNIFEKEYYWLDIFHQYHKDQLESPQFEPYYSIGIQEP